jgi:hypothetical protein
VRLSLATAISGRLVRLIVEAALYFMLDREAVFLGLDGVFNFDALRTGSKAQPMPWLQALLCVYLKSIW